MRDGKEGATASASAQIDGFSLTWRFDKGTLRRTEGCVRVDANEAIGWSQRGAVAFRGVVRGRFLDSSASETRDGTRLKGRQVMSVYHGPVTWVVAVLLAVLPAVAWGQDALEPETGPALPEAAGQPEAGGAAGAGVGHVRGNDVYVRSGSHQNYYPVTKLNRGDRIEIVGSEYGWLEIKPPAGAHSLIEKTYVDRVSDQSGVVNDVAQVYAGSNLNDRRYAKQVRLSKGSAVEIIGETSDGAFYKIQPPAGATLWIKGDLVDQTGRLADAGQEGSPSGPRIEPVRPGELALPGSPTEAALATQPAGPDAVRPVPRVSPAPRRVDDDQDQMVITAIEAEIAAEAAKPLGERNYEPLIAKLQPLVEGAADETTQLYAQTRIRQLQDHASLVAALREMRDLKEKTFDTADALAAARARIKAEEAIPGSDIVVRGEIHVSSLYSGVAGRPHRWRIVDPNRNATTAYIELPPGSPIDPVQYYGKYVGIRASARRMQQGTTPPLPIFTVQEIVVLDRQAPSQVSASVEVPVALPTEAVAEPPATQPATQTE